MDPLHQHLLNQNRRHFLQKLGLGIGGLALGGLMDPFSHSGSEAATSLLQIGSVPLPHFAPKAKRVIYLFQSGGPSQLDLFDYKPVLNRMRGQDLPESVRKGQRLTGMTSGQESFPLTGSVFDFKQHGESRAWVSELMPYTAKIADELCFVKSMHTEAINHDPAITFFQTGSQQSGRPSFGSWMSYGLGSLNANLPAFIVMLSRGSGRPNGQPLYSRLWGNGFLSSLHQGVQFRAGKDPVLYLKNPDGISRKDRRQMLDYLAAMNEEQEKIFGDPEVANRIAQYEMAYRMQTSVTDVMNIDKEPDHVFQMYGPDALTPGTFAANCILARRLAERDVRFIQLYHMGWDQHDNLPTQIAKQAKDVDQPSAALIMDLKQRGLLEDTLVIWGGEFGRTNYSQGTLTEKNYGRDHHPRSFTMFMAGGGIKAGLTHGETDEFGYNIIKDPVHVHDLQATMLHQLGVDHTKLTYKYQGRRFRLTDVSGNVIHSILS
ncbi:MAG: DUF1501 domain-containing protein [Flavobacteriaceae bacterium]